MKVTSTGNRQRCTKDDGNEPHRGFYHVRLALGLEAAGFQPRVRELTFSQPSTNESFDSAVIVLVLRSMLGKPRCLDWGRSVGRQRHRLPSRSELLFGHHIGLKGSAAQHAPFWARDRQFYDLGGLARPLLTSSALSTRSYDFSRRTKVLLCANVASNLRTLFAPLAELRLVHSPFELNAAARRFCPDLIVCEVCTEEGWNDVQAQRGHWKLHVVCTGTWQPLLAGLDPAVFLSSPRLSFLLLSLVGARYSEGSTSARGAGVA